MSAEKKMSSLEKFSSVGSLIAMFIIAFVALSSFNLAETVMKNYRGTAFGYPKPDGFQVPGLNEVRGVVEISPKEKWIVLKPRDGDSRVFRLAENANPPIKGKVFIEIVQEQGKNKVLYYPCPENTE